MSRLSVSQAEALVEKYVGRFGFGDYGYTVRLLPKEWYGKRWAHVSFCHEDGWFVLEVVPDGVLPARELESVVLHELAHGLLELPAELGDAGHEQAANRIARLVMGRRWNHPNHWMRLKRGAEPVDHRAMSAEFDPRPWLPLVVDGLPEAEAQVIDLVFYGERSLREAAVELGVSYQHVARIRDRALDRLREYLERLEELHP